MTETGIQSYVTALRRGWSGLHLQWRALTTRAALRRPQRRRPQAFHALVARRSPVLRRCAISATILFVVVGTGFGVLWWQLESGPISLDLMTPWLTSAIEERFGGNHRFEVGGTVIERDETGRTALRLRDIVVRAADGTIVASAPKAEVGIAATSLLVGHVQAERLSLIGAEMAVRVGPDGEVTLYAGPDRHPLALAPAAVVPTPSAMPAPASDPGTAAPPREAKDPLAAFLAWIDRLDSLGLDGSALAEVGLKNGTLVVDDQRSGKRWTFEHINLSLTRPREGGFAFAVNSTGADGLWSVIATIAPKADGGRTIEAVVRDLSPKDLMLALRTNDAQFAADMPLSAVVRAEIERDGTPHAIEGRIVAGAGYIGSREDTANRILIDEAQLNLRWVAASRQLLMPLEVQAGGNRVTLFAQLDAPAESGGPWSFAITRGAIALSAIDGSREPPLVMDRIAVRAKLDPAKRVLTVEQGDVGGVVGSIAFRGVVDYATADPRLNFGITGTKMPVSVFKRLWPIFAVPAVRSWVQERASNGSVESVVIATNAPLSTLRPGGPPLPDDGLSVDIVANGVTLQLLDGLPPLRDADVTTRVVGRTATVRVGRAIADLPSGRKLTMVNGTFEVPDTHPKPAPARTRLRVEGSADAAAELVAMERLRDAAGLQIDPATTRGSFVAQLGLDFALTGDLTSGVNYLIEADIANLSVEHLARGQKVEAAALKLIANPQGFYTKGEVKIGGLVALIDYRKPASAAEAEVRLQTTLDDAARARLGLGLNATMSGPVPVKLHGRVGANDISRFQVEADLKDARITELLPGWWKAPGKPTRVSFVFVDKPQSMRFEDLVIEGSGTQVKGLVEVDQNGDIVLASFPVFALSDGDKATLRADRAPDGTLKVTMRGEVFDGRGFIKAAVAGPVAERVKQSVRDFDLDIKVGAVTGHHGETLRGLELRLSRRAGLIRSLGLNAKLGRDGALFGDLRAYTGGRQVVYLESNDAGALFRFTDTYPRIFGGQMWVAMDPPTSDQQTPQEGILNVRDFAVRGEAALDRVVAGGNLNDPSGRMPQAIGAGVAFSRMRVDFTRSPGKLTIRDGVVWGPAIGATVDGELDYARDNVRMRGTFVPAYALNNMLARVPIVGLIIGGSHNEGLIGVTFEVVGPPNTPILRVNPMSAIMPGVFRKIFEFRGADDRAYSPPPSAATR